MTEGERDRLRAIKTFPQLVEYLRDDLDWPVESASFDALTYDYTADELGIDEKTAVKIQEIKQLRPPPGGTPFGIFFLKFEPKRLPVVVLRKILARLVFNKRGTAKLTELKAWEKHDLLFISNYGEGDHRQITFAHFSDNEAHKDLPVLKVLGWDDDTPRSASTPPTRRCGSSSAGPPNPPTPRVGAPPGGPRSRSATGRSSRSRRSWPLPWLTSPGISASASAPVCASSPKRDHSRSSWPDSAPR